MDKKGAGNALGVIGIIVMILIIDSVFLWFAGQIGSDIAETREFSYGDTSCDCGTITCQEYKLIYGQARLDALCDSQNTGGGFVIDIITGLSEVPILGVIVLISNIALIIAVVVIARGGQG